MIRIIQCFLLGIVLLYSSNGWSQDTNSVELHLQIYDEGICYPLVKSNFYSTSRFQKSKAVFEAGAYFNTIFVEVISSDSADLKPTSNHKLQSGSLRLKPDLEYTLVISRGDGFDRANPGKMLIKIPKLKKDAQVIIPFEKGEFHLTKMEFFKELELKSQPNFRTLESKKFKSTLKLDSTAFFPNGRQKAKYYIVADNFPLYFVEEFDSINENLYSQGFHVLQNYKLDGFQHGRSPWINSENTKYGYWEYFENGKRVKHELWASVPQEKFEWYASGELKSESYYGHYNQGLRYVHYLANGLIKREFSAQSQTNLGLIKSYNYSPQGILILIDIYKSSNGITKQELYKRELFYPNGKIKMKEELGGNYYIKYYNEDGTARIK